MSQSTHRVYRTGDEPVAGYQLQQFLGRGGFGEVWRVIGPGGVPAALKIIHDLDRKHGGKELKALRLLRDIRHPNLVPLTAFWLKSEDGETLSADSLWELDMASPVRGDSRGTIRLPTESPTSAAVLNSNLPAELVIAMGLAEKSLYDRLRECTDEGWSGVPLEELLTYLEDAARAIDLLNIKHDIQHCDIKPQNILLLGGAAQVCDFGLAKMIGEVRETSMGAGTIAYGAPEVLLGKGPTSTTDQYSLAISYVELRTGQLPFASERISDVLHAKQDGAVDLSQLSPAEQDVIARAAANDPSQRFDTCCDMLRALRANSNSCGTLPNPSRRPRALVDTNRGRTTANTRGISMTRRRDWRVAITGLVAVSVALGSVAWLWNLRAASQAADHSTSETLIAAEHALAAAAAALDRASQIAREHESDATTNVAMPPTDSTAKLELPSRTTSTVSETAGPSVIQPLPVPGESVEVHPATPPAAVNPAVVPPSETPPAADPPMATPAVDKSLESTLNQVATATVTPAANSQAIAEAQPTAVATQHIDSTARDSVVEDARRRLALPHHNDTTLANPVRISAQLTNDSWMVNLLIAEPAKQIWCQVGGIGQFESTGFQDIVEQRSGSPSPKTHLSLPIDTPATTLLVKYTDTRGHERGPFELPFDPDHQRQAHGKQILEGFPHSWLSIRDFEGRRLAYVTHLLSYRYAIGEVRYSIDTQELGENVSLPDWSPTRPHEIPAHAQTFLELPTGAKFVEVQLTYRDGTQSKPRRFNVPQ